MTEQGLRMPAPRKENVYDSVDRQSGQETGGEQAKTCDTSASSTAKIQETVQIICPQGAESKRKPIESEVITRRLSGIGAVVALSFLATVATLILALKMMMMMSGNLPSGASVHTAAVRGKQNNCNGYIRNGIKYTAQIKGSELSVFFFCLFCFPFSHIEFLRCMHLLSFKL